MGTVYLLGQLALSAFAEPVKISLWAVWSRATCTVHLISGQDQPGSKRMYYYIREAKVFFSDFITNAPLVV